MCVLRIFHLFSKNIQPIRLKFYTVLCHDTLQLEKLEKVSVVWVIRHKLCMIYSFICCTFITFLDPCPSVCHSFRMSVRLSVCMFFWPFSKTALRMIAEDIWLFVWARWFLWKKFLITDYLGLSVVSYKGDFLLFLSFSPKWP